MRNQHAGLSYTRTIGVVADAVKMYEYTGDRKHLDNAVRLWKTFQPTQGADLLFTRERQAGRGQRPVHRQRRAGLQDALREALYRAVCHQRPALPASPHCRPDERLRATILALNDWMARVQQPGRRMGLSSPGDGRPDVEPRVRARAAAGL